MVRVPGAFRESPTPTALDDTAIGKLKLAATSAGFNLNPEQIIEVGKVINKYVSFQSNIRQAPRVAKVRRLLLELRRCTDVSVTALNDLTAAIMQVECPSDDPEETGASVLSLLDGIRSPLPSTSLCHSLTEQLRTFTVALEHIQGSLPHDGGGPNTALQHFGIFVGGLADIFRLAGKDPTIYVDADGNYGTPFFQFLWAAQAAMPKEFTYQGLSLGKVAQKALINWRAQQE